MRSRKSVKVTKVPMPIVAHGRPVLDKEGQPVHFDDGQRACEGVVRLSGHTVHISSHLYDDPERAAKIAIKEFVKGLRHLMSQVEFDYPETEMEEID